MKKPRIAGLFHCQVGRNEVQRDLTMKKAGFTPAFFIWAGRSKIAPAIFEC
jgi:hypothetical protein